jgi:2-desacetyl-2-hydroxyethyl bacteriochlorophyllide A dehydrogenase
LKDRQYDFGANMNRKSLYYLNPFKIGIKTEKVAEPAADEVLVESLYSAISAGTEMLFYRGNHPPRLELDTHIHSLKQKIQYPFKYGYAIVGRIIKTGSQLDSALLGKHVFSFHPHESHFTATSGEFLILPDNLSLKTCLFFPFCETAINLLLDGQPLIGEDVLVIGQGIIGLLTTALLKSFPLHTLITLDKLPFRRTYSTNMGADLCLESYDRETSSEQKNKELNEKIETFLKTRGNDRGLDLIYELSGDMNALNLACQLASFSGRIIIGSWYGTKGGTLELGGTFHRKRVQIKSSQVSTLSPEITGRWDKTRRNFITWKTLGTLQPESFITHTIPFESAETAYHLIDTQAEPTLQVVLKY